MDVTYISTTFPTINNNRHTPLITTRIMTKILNNQKKLNVIYSELPKDVAIDYYKYSIKKRIYDYTDFHKEYIKNNIHKIETEYVLLTIGNQWEIVFLIELLKRGKKVVVGGPFVKQYDLKILREMVSINGGTNHLNNLLIVRPYINEKVDLYDIIKKWEDIDINIDYDVSDLYINSDKDYYLDFLPEIESNGIYINQISLFLSTFCAWAKCNFCKYHDTKHKKKFFNENNIRHVVKTTNNILNSYHTKIIMISDPEFYFNKDNIKILKLLKKFDVKIYIFTSIRLLNDDNYFNNLKKYHEVIDLVIPGIESLDDFSLNLLGKGHNFNDVLKVATKIMNFNSTVSSPINIMGLFMENLATKNKQHVIENYNRQNVLLELLQSSPDTIYIPSITSFKFTPLTRYVINNPFLKPKGHHLNVLNDYIRFDENGNEMPKDKDIVDNFLYNKLINYKRF
jgi:radical SAM superfamily enzyme YgiQ (UPF0313 family)